MRHLDLGFFHALEDDLERLSRFIDFTSDNFGTYSMELVRLLLASGSEVDVALKDLCRLVDHTKKPKNISEWQKIVIREFPEIASQEVRIPRYDLRLVPWASWGAKAPKWWRAYNDVKHERTVFYRDGNLENVLNAVAGLGVIMQFLGSRSRENFRGHFFSNIRFRVLRWNE